MIDRKRSVLITGGLGFVGSFLAERYLARDWIVGIVDDRRACVVDDVPGAMCWYRTVEDFVSSEADAFGDFDLVVHAASPVGAAGILEHRGRIIPQIVDGARAIAGACRHIPLVLISTSEVYGKTAISQEDDDLRVHPTPSARREYAVGKIAAEYIVRELCRQVVVLRPFNLAGPRQPREKGFVIPTFVEQALAGEPMTVFGDGQQQRAFLSIHDFVDFVMALQEPHFAGGIINVGNPANTTTIMGLAARIARAVGTYPEGDRFCFLTDGKQIYGDAYEEALGVHKLPNIERAHMLTGWEPQTPLDAIVQQTAAEIEVERLAAS